MRFGEANAPKFSPEGEYFLTVFREYEAHWTLPGRLGTAMTVDAVDYWADMMGATPLSTQLGFMRIVPEVDVGGGLPRNRVPDARDHDEGQRLGSVDEVTACSAASRAWSCSRCRAARTTSPRRMPTRARRRRSRSSSATALGASGRRLS